MTTRVMLTEDFLLTNAACRSQLELFRVAFGDGAEVTVANALRAIAAGLRVSWVIGRLSRPAQRTYAATRRRAERDHRDAVLAAEGDPTVIVRANEAYAAAIADGFVRACAEAARGDDL